ncbi:sodium:calcium antiporter [Marinococcus halophilus]|uniref:sodium:calcium antiporter n=1 Tax=Marinococcus halophilus TaxID=1371 RepID=UPI0021C07439|nr:sodium:calcium antiporter [Marinococcus halophilus]
MVAFILSAAVSVFSAVKLSGYADIISRNTKIGGLLAGTILLAVATSLPELTATISASVIGNADIAVGNGLGSIIFNIFFLFLLDIYFRNKRLFLKVSDDHLYTAIIALLLCVVTAGGLILHYPLSYFGVSVISLLVVIIYLGGMFYISQKQNDTAEEEKTASPDQNVNIRRTIIKFITFAVIIFISGSTLSISGDIMSTTTGISATAVGSILVATATSLPDAVSVFVALRLANVNMAIGTILGSNIFNVLVTAIGDAFYRGGSIWVDTSNQTTVVAVAGFVLTGLVMIIVKRDRTRNAFTYMLPSLVVVTGYMIMIASILFYNESA